MNYNGYWHWPTTNWTNTLIEHQIHSNKRAKSCTRMLESLWKMRNVMASNVLCSTVAKVQNIFVCAILFVGNRKPIVLDSSLTIGFTILYSSRHLFMLSPAILGWSLRLFLTLSIAISCCLLTAKRAWRSDEISILRRLFRQGKESKLVFFLSVGSSGFEPATLMLTKHRS